MSEASDESDTCRFFAVCSARGGHYFQDKVVPSSGFNTGLLEGSFRPLKKVVPREQRHVVLPDDEGRKVVKVGNERLDNGSLLRVSTVIYYSTFQGR